jgi:hypothetical protein
MYLTETQMAALISEAKSLRKGHKLNAARDPYTVIVDGQHHPFASTVSLHRFLNDCSMPEKINMFRNADKGVTIMLD